MPTQLLSHRKRCSLSNNNGSRIKPKGMEKNIMCETEYEVDVEKYTTSSTTSMAETLEPRAEMPRLRQRVRSCFASSWRWRGRFGSTPAPPCTAIAQPPIFLSLWLSLSLPLCFLFLCMWRLQQLLWSKGWFYRQFRISKAYVLQLNLGSRGKKS